MSDTIYFVPDCARQHLDLADALSGRYPDLAVTYRSAALMMAPDLDYSLSIETDSDGSRVEKFTPKRKPPTRREFLAELRNERLGTASEPIETAVIEIVFSSEHAFVRQSPLTI